jgi:hypothetical protein
MAPSLKFKVWKTFGIVLPCYYDRGYITQPHEVRSYFMVNDRPVISSERVPHINKTEAVLTVA